MPHFARTAKANTAFLVNSNDESIIIVRRGSAEVSTPQGSTHVEQGQMITIQGARQSPVQDRSRARPGRLGFMVQ